MYIHPFANNISQYFEKCDELAGDWYLPSFWPEKFKEKE